ncbi:MAG TPA: polyprenyl synthetase family protein [Anaerolineae bacterium]|nr:polyprenyl synthetase family protein [Anaerolineae bacterium]
MNEQAVDEAVAAVETKLAEIVRSDVQVLDEASLHIIGAGGKRMRPRLVFWSYLIGGGDDLLSAVPLAASVELLHTATLVHDDINDESYLRRGRPSVHSLWGNTFGLLTGDYLFSKVYQLVAPYGPAYNTIMATTAIELIEGEALQALAAKEGEMDSKTYKKVIRGKTASLFEAAARMGAMWGGGEEETVAAVSVYGAELGLAFQIVDDILDLVGDAETLGKPVGLDTSQSKGVGMTLAEGEGEAEVEMDPVQKMRADLLASGAVEVARLQARERARKAREALAEVPASYAKGELLSLIEQVLERDK